MPGRQLARIALWGDRTAFLFVFRAELIPKSEPSNLPEERAILHYLFEDTGWGSSQILQAMEVVEDIYFDRVNSAVLKEFAKEMISAVVATSSSICASVPL